MKKSIVFIALILFSLQGRNKQSFQQKAEHELDALPNKAFSFGEKLSYRVHYGVLNGGHAHFEIGDKPVTVNDRSTYYIKVYGKSTGLVDVMFRVRDEFESFMDVEALVPWKATKKIKEGDYTDSDFIIFDHKRRIVTSRRGQLAIAPNTQDLISSLYYARSMDMTNAKPGDLFPMNFFLDNKNYEFRFKFMGREEIQIEAGKFRALKFRPQVIEGRVFKDSEAITLWVSDDENKVPLRVESEIWVGSLKADLVQYTGLRNPLTSRIGD